METGPPPQGGQGAHHQHLRIEWWVLPDLRHHLPRAPPSTFFSIDGGHSRISVTTSRGVSSMFFSVDGGHSRISVTTPQGSTIDVFCVDGGHPRTSGTASQGAHRRCFSALIVGAPGSPSTPPGAHHRRFLCWLWALLDLRTASQGPTIDVF
jgi:hypothetical protein